MTKKLLLYIMLFCAHIASAQYYPFYNLGVENGLIQSQVESIAQDKNGHLWIGTRGGLSRYDGTSFKNYNVRDGLLDNACYAVTIDSSGNIWVGGERGISSFNGNSFKHFKIQTNESTGTLPVKKLKVSADGSLYCYTDSNLYKVLNDTISEISLPQKGLRIESIAIYRDTLWVGTGSGKVFRQANNKWDSLFYYIPYNNKPALHTLDIHRDRNGRMLFATGNGLFYNSNDSLKVVEIDDVKLYSSRPLLEIVEENDGAIWLSSFSGIYRITDSTYKRYGKAEGFIDNKVNALIKDREGNLWMGTDGKGLYRFSGNKVSILNEKTGLKSEQAMSFAATPKGNLYIGTADAGLFLYKGGQLSPVSLKRNNAFISSLIAENEYDVWMGILGIGLCRKKGSEFIQYKLPDATTTVTILDIYKDNSGTLYFSTSNGVYTYNNNQFNHIPDYNDGVYSLTKIGTDSILLASANGLKLLHKNTVQDFVTNSVADSSSIRSLIKLGNDLWLGSTDNGVIKYNLSTHKSYTINKESGLQSDFVYNIIADDSGHIWAGTGYGIHKIEWINEQPNITFYGKQQGITGIESNQNAVCKMPDGSLWFGTTKGAVHIDPNKKNLEPEPISLILQSVKLFGDNINDTTYYDSLDNWYKVPYQLRLPFKKNNVTFSFKGISLSNAQQLLYRYHIDGLDDQWSDWTHLNTVTYSALPPNKYTLQVECKNSDGSTIKTLSYPFEIITPIHKTVWFSWLVFAACILAGITIQYIINKRKQNRLELVNRLRREEQGKVRQRTAEDFHDEVGNRLTRINVLTNVLKEKLKGLSPGDLRIINQIEENTAELYGGTRDILWSLQSTNDNLHVILHRIRDFGTELFEDTNIQFEFTGKDTRWHNYRLPLDMSRNFIMIFKEALNNSLKYSNASIVKIHTELKDQDILHVSLKDNGIGFNVEEVVKGNGLNNMRNRTKRLKGKIYIDSKLGEGTIINLHFHLPEKIK